MAREYCREAEPDENNKKNCRAIKQLVPSLHRQPIFNTSLIELNSLARISNFNGLGFPMPVCVSA
jgi:hypothetical protein